MSVVGILVTVGSGGFDAPFITVGRTESVIPASSTEELDGQLGHVDLMRMRLESMAAEIVEEAGRQLEQLRQQLEERGPA